MKNFLKLFIATLLFVTMANYAFAYDFEAVCSSGQTLYYNILSVYNVTGTRYVVEVVSENTSNPYYSTYPSGNLVIPSSVTYNNIEYPVVMIHNSAFYGCSELTSITIPNSVSSIGSSAFRDCSGLTEMTIPFVGNSGSYATTASASTLFGYIFGYSTSSVWGTIQQHYSSTSSIYAYIPSSLRSVTVTGGSELLYGAFSNCSMLTSVTIGEGCTSIGNLAFSCCTRLASVTIPNSVTSIGEEAFYNCRGLTSVTIPNSITSIGEEAFFGCRVLTGTLTIPNSVTSIGENAFFECFRLTTVNFNATNCTSMGSFDSPVFWNCTSLTTLNIGSNVTNIPSYAFYGSRLTGELAIPNSVTNIGTSAFYNCNNLTSMSLGESVAIIGNSAFYGCSGLTGELTIPNSVTNIGESAFQSCSGLTEVNFNPTNCTAMGSGSYPVFSNCTSFATLNIGENVTNIPSYAFYGCSRLTGELTIPNSVTYIGESAFYGCSGLTSVTIPNSVTSIGSYAFSGCSGLTSVNFNATNCTFGNNNGITGNASIRTLTIGESVANYPVSAFSGLSGLTAVYYNRSIAGWCGITFGGTDYNPVYYAHNLYINGELLTNLVIPESVAEIKPYSFCGASCITSVTIPNSVTSIGNYAFSGCSGLTGELTIPNSVTNIGESAFGNCSGLTTVNFNPTNCTAMGSSSYPVFSNCTSLTTLNIGSNVTNIPSYAFYGCSRLTGELAIPNSVTNIGTSAFYNCNNLTSMSLGESVAIIGNSAFYGCSGLTGELTIPNSVTYIGESAFYNCRNLTSAVIGNSVTSIGNSAFQYCSGLTAVNFNPTNCTVMGSSSSPVFSNCTSLSTLNIGENVTNIPSYAFYGCSGLTGELTIPNSVTNIGDESFLNCNGLTTLSLGESVATIGNSAFSGCSGLMGALTIPNLVTYIGESVFYNCGSLTELTLGESLLTIGNSAFSGCCALTTLNYNPINCTTWGSNNGITGNANLTTLTIGENVTIIPNAAFSGCSGLTGTLTIQNSVTSIGNSAFYGCGGISSLTIGESVTSIGESAFKNCSAIRTMTLGSNVATLGNNAFANCTGILMITAKPEFPPMAQSGTFTNMSSTAVIKVPCGSVPYYTAAQYWNYFTNVQGDYVYSLTVGSNNSAMGYATVVQAPNCNNPSGVISATAYDHYRFDSWNDGNTENPRTVTLISDANYIANFASLYPTVYNSFEAEACGSYTWNGTNYTESGEYQQTFTATNSADSIVTLTLTIHPMPTPTIAPSGELDACNPTMVTLSVGEYSTYQWSNGATSATIEINAPGYYFVEVSDAYGCTGISEQINIGLSNNLPEAPQISVVGMNSDNHNVLVWSALDNENVNGYHIYRENNVADVYEPIAVIDASETLWTDETADPTARAYRYKVTAVDECGGESPMSDYHKTMHLTINQGIGSTWNLIWSHYEGFSFGTYRIYRGTTPSNMTMIGEVPSNLNSYTDNTSVANTAYYYQVEVVRNTRSRDAEISSRSNIVSSNPNAIENITAQEIAIFPNPATDILNISSSETISEIEIVNVMGQVVYSTKVNADNAVLRCGRIDGWCLYCKDTRTRGCIGYLPTEIH